MKTVKELIDFARYVFDWKRIRMYLIIVGAYILVLALSCHFQYVRDVRRFEAEKAELIEFYTTELEAAASQISSVTPLVADAENISEYNAEAEEIAKVLYGYRNNSDEDLRLVVWCIINRKEHYGHPDTIIGVCQQPKQWMGYSAENPIMEDLYEIAEQELATYYEGGHRSIGPEFIYMEWSSKEIVLRDTFEIGKKTRFYRD